MITLTPPRAGPAAARIEPGIKIYGPGDAPLWALDRVTEVGSLEDRDLTIGRRDRVGCIFPAFNLIPPLTAAENTLLPPSLAGVTPDEDWYRAALPARMRQPAPEFGQTIVIITHDPIAAGYSERIVFLDDGPAVAERCDPTMEATFDVMKSRGVGT